MEGETSLQPQGFQAAPRVRRRWRSFVFPTLLILGVGVIVIIVIIVLNATGVIDDGGSSNNNTPEVGEITYDSLGEEFSAKADDLITSGADTEEMEELQLELVEYLASKAEEDVQPGDVLDAVLALARLDFAEGRSDETIVLLKSVAEASSSAETQIDCYATIYNYYASINDYDGQVEYLEKILGYPETTTMSKEYFPDIYRYYQAAYDKLVNRGGEE